MPAQYPLKVQAIRSSGKKERLYVYLPIPLAAAIDLSPGELVHWQLLDRNELRLVRDHPPQVATHRPLGK
jgi:hypothetical protein